MTRCKVGDLAFICTSDFPSNIGAVVEIVRQCPPDQWMNSWSPEWECRSSSPLEGEEWDFPGTTCDDPLMIDIEDCALRPISGVPVHEEVTDEVPA